jgi:predicted porin
LGASYDFGVVKLGAVYGQLKSNNDVYDSKTKQWMVGATIPVGAAGNVLVSYARNKTDIDDKGVIALGGDRSAKASKWALGYTHSLSKRTNLYAVYAKISTNNDGERAFSVYNGNVNPVNGTMGNDYTSGLNLGVRHQF